MSQRPSLIMNRRHGQVVDERVPILYLIDEMNSDEGLRAHCFNTTKPVIRDHPNTKIGLYCDYFSMKAVKRYQTFL